MIDTGLDKATALPLLEPWTLSVGQPLTTATVCDDDVSAVTLSGRIGSTGTGAPNDIVISVALEDGFGNPLTNICEGLVWSPEAGYYFYPLRGTKNGFFTKSFYVTAPVARIVVTALVWRPQTAAQYVVHQLSMTCRRYDPRFAAVPATLPEGSSLAWLLGEIHGDRPVPGGRALDISTDGSNSEISTRRIVDAFGKSGRVDCLRLETSPRTDFRIFVVGAHLVFDPLGKVPAERQYGLIAIYPHNFTWVTLLATLPRLEELLADDGHLIVAMPTRTGAEPEPWCRRFVESFGAPEISLVAIEDILKQSPFNPVGLVPLVDPAGTSSPMSWVILRKLEVFVRLRETPGFSEAMARGEWGAAAQALDPMLRSSTTHPKLANYLGHFAERFAEEAKGFGKRGQHQVALACKLAASMLNPKSEAYICELIAALRTAGEISYAARIQEEAKSLFPQSWSVRLQGALLLSVSGQGLEACSIMMDYVRAMPRLNASMRRTISTVMRSYANECQRAGVDTDSPQPLLLPEVALKYNADMHANAERWFLAPQTKILEHDAQQRAFERRQACQAALEASAGEPTDDASPRPLRLLLLSSGNWKFVLNLLRCMETDQSSFDVRTFDFAFTEETIGKENLHELFAPVSLGLDQAAVWKRTVDADSTLGDLIEWSDVVFCEWSGTHAVWLSRFMPPHKRLVVRLHSYEAFSQWPFFMNYGGLDGMIFVADHIRKFADIQFRMSEHGFPIASLPNFNDLSRFARPKKPEASRTLAMVGYSNVNKDPLLAAKILAKLRESDAKWMLHLIGHPWVETNLVGKELSYFHAFRDYVRDHGLEDAIVFKTYSKDISGPLEEVGFILSCSWREGTHEALLEGMATGAVPIVRRWPMVSVFGAPQSVYPGLDFYDTVDEAAEMILACAAPAKFKTRSKAAIEYAMSHFDQSVVYPEFVKFIQRIATDPVRQ